MTEPDDRSLLNDYSTQRSEQAFRSLVERYLALVYSTAFRQLGDRTLAEEVAQNVFLALARKPQLFRYGATLSSWFYKTTLLQTRQCIRTELRRKRREETAVELGTLSHAEPDWAPLVPMLDEAVLSLRETDRMAVVLRYLEEKPFREVGDALGISEEAARKRVSNALDRLTDFFRRRGFVVPVATVLSAPLFTETSKAVPAGLAAVLTQFVLREASVAPISGAALFLTKLMAITKTQTAALCIVAGVIPAAIQWNTLSSVHAESAKLHEQLKQAHDESQEADAALASLEARRRASEADLAALREIAKQKNATAAPIAAEPSSYPWSETSDYARVPKSLLKKVAIPPGVKTAVGTTRIPISDELKAVLRLTPDEESKLNSLLDNTKQRYRQLEASYMEPSSENVKQELMIQVMESLKEPAEIVSFTLNPFPEDREAFWKDFDPSLRAILGPERASLFTEQADVTVHWMAGERLLRNHDLLSITYSYLMKESPESAVYLAFQFNGGGGGGYLLDPSEDRYAPDSMKPILARWRSQIAATKTQAGGNQP